MGVFLFLDLSKKWFLIWNEGNGIEDGRRSNQAVRGN